MSRIKSGFWDGIQRIFYREREAPIRKELSGKEIHDAVDEMDYDEARVYIKSLSVRERDAYSDYLLENSEMGSWERRQRQRLGMDPREFYDIEHGVCDCD